MSVGDTVRLTVSTSGREIVGEVLGIDETGAVLLDQAPGVPTRWYPGHWVVEVIRR